MERGRAHWFEPGELSAEQRELYEAIASGPRSTGPQSFALTDERGRLHGPFNAMLYQPALGTALQQLGGAIRYRGELTARSREIAILEVAVLHRSEFEWFAHARVGRDIGLTSEELDALHARVEAPTFSSDERLVRELVQALVSERDVADDAFDAARDRLGPGVLMELVTLVGYYELLALGLRFWRTPLPNGATPVFD